MLKSGRKQEALSSFLKVIAKRGDDAPESHLEVGLLYYTHINDPISAIYHFKKYLALRPNSTQAPLVKQRIDAALRAFARTLPAQPLEDTVQRVDLIAAMDKMKLENELLKQQISDLKAGRESAAEPAESTLRVTPAANNPPVDSAAGKLTLNFDSLPVVRTRPARAQPEPIKPAAGKPTATGPALRPASAPQSKPATPAAELARGGRKHTVQPGDTLSKISLKYYGNRSRWRDILNANHKVMRNEGDLHAGQELVIP